MYKDNSFSFPHIFSDNESNISSISYGERNIYSESEADIFPMYINGLNPLNPIKDYKEISYGKNSCSESESEFNINEQFIEKENFLKPSEITSNEPCVKSDINFFNNDLSSMNIDIFNNFNINNESNSRPNDNNENLNFKEENNCVFIGKKRKFSEENNRNQFYIFTQSENDNDSRRLINEVKNANYIKIYFSTETFNSTSEEEKHNSINKKEKKKKRKNNKSRKDDADMITKKIKTKFLKLLKIKINEILKSAGSKKKFTYLQPSFIENLKKNINIRIFNATLEELLLTNFIDFMEDKNIKKTDYTNYEHNKSVLEFLKNNKKYKDVNFDFLNMTYVQIFNEYLNSKEFEMEIDKLKKKKSMEYIKNYIINTFNFFNFFLK